MAAPKCKYGRLKCRVGNRVCKKKPRKAKKASTAKNCRWGRLKTPTKTGRVCKRRPGGKKK